MTTSSSHTFTLDERGQVLVGLPTGTVRLPPEVAEELINYGRQTVPGAALWRGYLLGAGLPKGDGALTVRDAIYAPKPAEPG